MVIISRKIYFFKIHENWFADQLRFLNPFSLRAYMNVRNCRIHFPFGIRRVYPTVENLLTLDAETIFAGFSPSNRNNIHRAERAGIICYFHQDQQGFVNYYNDFASHKNLPPITTKKISEWGPNMVMSYAILNGEILAAHVYQIDGQEGIARGEYFANSRFNESVNGAIAMIANRLLHYQDMLYLKEKGFKFYNWGGYFDTEGGQAIPGLLKFKLSFGGEEVYYANYYSLGYYLLRKVARFTGLVGKRGEKK